MEVPNETLDELLQLIDKLIIDNENLQSLYRIQNKLLADKTIKNLQNKWLNIDLKELL